MNISQKRVVYRIWHNQSAKGRIGYVGKDADYPKRLNLFHRAKDKKCRKLYNALNKYPLSIWKTEVLASGFRSATTLANAEISYIRKFNSKNKGYNCTDGGDGCAGIKHSNQTKEKISKALRGQRLSEETKAKIGAALKGRTFSMEAREKLAAAHRGKKLSAEHRKKLSNAHKGKKFSIETRRKMSRALKGNKNAIGGRKTVE